MADSATSQALIDLRESIGLLHAQAAADGPDEVSERLEKALAAIGAPAIVPAPPMDLTDQFPAQLFHAASASLERAADGTDDWLALLDCWLLLRAARTAWEASTSR